MSLGMKHFDWLILVVGPLSCICRLTFVQLGLKEVFQGSIVIFCIDNVVAAEKT